MMGKQHDTIPNEPQEAPVKPSRPEVPPPNNPRATPLPQEVPGDEPQELPQQADQEGSELNQTKV